VLRLNLQFYGFFVTLLCGSALGITYDLLRVVRRLYQPGRWTAPAVDVVFWAVAAATLSSGLFFANWAELRLYVVIGILIGIGLYLWLASPVVSYLMEVTLRAVGWLLHGAYQLIKAVLWRPLVAIVILVVAALKLLVDWGLVVGTWIVRIVVRFLGWLFRPFRGQFRCVKFKYLRFTRKWRWICRR